MFFIYNINTLCFRTIDNEKRKNLSSTYKCNFLGADNKQ